VVQKSVRELAPPSARDLARLRRAMEKDIDTTEIPERGPGRAVRARRLREGNRRARFGARYFCDEEWRCTVAAWGIWIGGEVRRWRRVAQ